MLRSSSAPDERACAALGVTVDSQVVAVVSGRRNWRRFGEGRALGSVFLLNGLLISSWASEIPVVQQTLRLSTSGLGLLLLALPAGTVLILPAVTWMLRRYSPQIVIHVGLAAQVLALCCVALAGSAAVAAALLLLFGSAFAAVDVATNAASVRLEARCRRPLLSGLHGLFSVGALAGALVGSALLARSVPVGAHFLGAALAALLALAVISRALRPTPEPGQKEDPVSPDAMKPVRQRSGRALLALGGLAFCASVAEGSVADWSGVYLRTAAHAAPGLWSLGFATFSLAMIAGRLLGDRLTLRLGRTRLVRLGGLLAAGCLLLTLSLPSPWVVIGGFGGMGLGVSVLGPVAFSAVGDLFPHGVPAVMALVSALFQAGYLSGPTMIAALATTASLRLALLSVVALLLCAAALAQLLHGPATDRASGREALSGRPVPD